MVIGSVFLLGRGQVSDVNFSGAGLIPCGNSIELRLRIRQQFTGDHDPREDANFSSDLLIAIGIPLRS
jgi:hypothetical protein